MLASDAKFYRATFSETNSTFFRPFIQTQKCFPKLNKMLNRCLDFSLLIDDFAAVKAQKRLV